MRIIINADDLGISPAVNQAIFGLMDSRRLTSATLLANGAALEEAVARIPDYPHCSFGVHLNLTEGRPLTSNSDLRLILDETGRIVPDAIRRVPLTSSLRRAVYCEWAAQIEKLLSLGVPISHIDSHHFVHTIARLFFVLKRLQRRYGIRRVRLSKNLYSPAEGASWRLLLAKRFWNAALRNYHRTATTCDFTSLQTFIELASSRPLACESVELMTHPGHPEFDAETRLV